ncbi:hypothetical protein ZWY2020_002552 [Hordeum vulgare]|nr:hypothetical protein ZWY2020_002552 [Hordeum vulgare]
MDGESSRRDNRESILQDKIASPHKLPFQYLKEITNNFSAERILGEGGFGVVYKGVLRNGEMMAVKKLMAYMPGFQKQFENEVYHLMRLTHPNIVRCVGYCYETQNLCLEYNGKYIFAETAERLLCLEYMPNGSLDNHLRDESCGLDWHKRYNIITGVCYGLHYLHEEWQISTPIIHLDLKPENILLDDNLLPKIADFGLSRLFGEQQTRACTINRDGTFGYMAPEYLQRGIITTKSDIFSLGVIIIEIITGHKNYPFGTGTSYHDFVELVLKNWRNRLKAPSCYALLETDYQQIRGCLEMGLSCLDTDPMKRPATGEIIGRLIEWGSTNFHVGSDERSPTLQITSDPSDFLGINPRELHTVKSSSTSCFPRAKSNDMLAYWLSNSSTLLLLMQRTMRTVTGGRFTPRRGKSFATIVDMIITRNRSLGGKGDLQQVEAKSPALLFKGHLTGFVKKVYGMIRDNLVKEISPLLGCCIEAPIILICEALFDHWQSIVNILTDYLRVLKSNYVPSFLISKMFTQVFSFIDVQLFNSLLLSECCSTNDGEYIKAGLAKLEQWCTYETEEYAGSSWQELKHIRRAAIFLTMREKQKETLEEISCHLCPVLSIPQLYRISTLYRDDRYGAHDVSPLIDILSSMESLMTEAVNEPVEYSLLLDDDTVSIPFSVDDILKLMTEFELTNVEMPALIQENPCFNFLHQGKD